MRFDWNPEKNAWLRQHRGISFEEIVVHLGRGDVWKTSAHPNRNKYPHQSIAFVVVDDYVYLVPFDVVGDVILLRTIIPSRKATKQYLADQRSPS
jgi:uncharacterized DUF497 family protein